MAEPLFDLEECMPSSSDWLYCESCTAAWQMQRRDATLCPSCGRTEFRRLTRDELVAILVRAMGSPEFIDVLTGDDGVAPEVTAFFQAGARMLHAALSEG